MITFYVEYSLRRPLLIQANHNAQKQALAWGLHWIAHLKNNSFFRLSPLKCSINPGKEMPSKKEGRGKGEWRQ